MVYAIHEYVYLCRVYGMCDESFSINCTVTPPEDVDRGWFMFFVTLLNHLYWVCGAIAGSLLGYVIHFDTTGIDFVMTALFVVIIPSMALIIVCFMALEKHLQPEVSE